jgi:hypothetical protein
MKSLCIAVLFAAALGGTAWAAPYKGSDISTLQIDEATVEITGRADANDKPETVRHHVLMRAAEETSNRGFDLFLLLPSPASASLTEASDSVLVMMFHGEMPSNAPGNLHRAIDVLEPIQPFVSALSRN